MKLPTRILVSLTALSLAATFVPARAQAFELNGFAGKYFGTNEQLSLTGEFLFTFLPFVSFGAFYDHSGESPSTHDLGSDESRSFYGVVGRVTLPIIPIFGDLRIGPHNISFTDGSSMTGFSTRFGLGYRIGLVPGLSLLPRIGVALADTNSTYPTWDGSVGVSLGF